LDNNNFSSGLSEAVASLVSLEELWLRNCRLTSLPSRFVLKMFLRVIVEKRVLFIFFSNNFEAV